MIGVASCRGVMVICLCLACGLVGAGELDLEDQVIAAARSYDVTAATVALAIAASAVIAAIVAASAAATAKVATIVAGAMRPPRVRRATMEAQHDGLF